MLGALYGSVSLDDLEADGMAVRYPLTGYQDWLASLPQQRQEELLHGGDPAQHWAVRERNGRRYLLIPRSEAHTTELQSLMRISYAVFGLKKKKKKKQTRKER